MMRQTLSWFRPPPVSKSLTTDNRLEKAIARSGVKMVAAKVAGAEGTG
jgi:hypothetical protein